MGVLNTKAVTLGALATALYVWTLAIGQVGDPFQFTLWIILIFRYLTPVFFGVMGAHYVVNMTVASLKLTRVFPLVVDSLVKLEGENMRGYYANALAFQTYATWVFYVVIYPVLIWWMFHRVGLYNRLNPRG